MLNRRISESLIVAPSVRDLSFFNGTVNGFAVVRVCPPCEQKKSALATPTRAQWRGAPTPSPCMRNCTHCCCGFFFLFFILRHSLEGAKSPLVRNVCEKETNWKCHTMTKTQD